MESSPENFESLRTLLRVIEPVPQQLEPGTDGEAGTRSEHPAGSTFGEQGACRQNLCGVLATSEKIDVTVARKGVIDPYVDDPADDTTAGGAVRESQRVSSVPVGAEQLRIDVDDADLLRHDAPP